MQRCKDKFPPTELRPAHLCLQLAEDKFRLKDCICRPEHSMYVSKLRRYDDIEAHRAKAAAVWANLRNSLSRVFSVWMRRRSNNG